MEPKKILIVAESIDVEDSSGSKANVALIENLKKNGFEIRVYHYTRKEIQLDEIPCISIKEDRKSLLFFLSRMERQLRLKSDIFLNKYIEANIGFSFTHLNDKNSIAEGLKKIKDFKPDLVLTLSKGSSFRPHHALLKLPQWHDRWVAYIHDPYPMHSYPRPYDWVEPGHQKKRRFFLSVSNNAKYAAYPSKLLADWMESYYPPLKGKAVVIPHQISLSIGKENTPEFFNKEKFTLVHAGLLMGARNPIGLVEGFKDFLTETPQSKKEAQLIFLGRKSVYSEYLSKIGESLPQIYSSESSMIFDVVQKIQAKASVNIILEADGPISPFLPGKFPHCVAAGKPILLLGPVKSESRRLLGDKYKYWSEINDAVRIKELIKDLYVQWKSSSNNLRLDRPDLVEYLSEVHLGKIMTPILNK